MSAGIPRADSPSAVALCLDLGAYLRLYDHVVAGYPAEVVGILAGSRARGQIQVIAPLVNEDPAATRRYAVSARALLQAEQALEADGHEVIGYYHSHPNHPAAWSDSDLAAALPGMAYLIAAVAPPVEDGAPPRITDLRSWRLREDRSAMDADHLILTAAS